MEIFQNTLIKLIIRQGTDSDRKRVVLTSGEMGYSTDTGRTFIGNGVLSGGQLVGNLFKGDFVGNTTGSIEPAEHGDIAFNTDTRKLYRLKHTNTGFLSSWSEIGGVYVSADPLITISSDNEISLEPLSANSISSDAVQAPIIITGTGKVGLSAKIPFTTVSTNTITTSGAVLSYVGGSNVTGTPINTLSADIFLTIGTLSANNFSNDAVQAPIIIDGNGRIGLSATIPFQSVSTKTILVSGGLQAYADGVNVTGLPVNTLSANLVIESTQLYAKYNGLNGQILSYSRGIAVNRLSAGDYNFTYGPLPTSNVIPMCQIHSVSAFGYVPRVTFADSSLCNVQILSSNGLSSVKSDADVYLSIIY